MIQVLFQALIFLLSLLAYCDQYCDQ